MSSKTIRIMIVDDDQDLAESLADLLQVHGYEVDIAKDGQDALEHARGQDFDITLMDVRMPVMNGVDSFLAIRKIKPQAGAEGPLHKPFSVDDLLKLVETVH
jgi:DNA-binding response OmpR family regulator